MKMLFFLKKINHYLHKNANWSIPNDLQLNELKGKVKVLSSDVSIVKENQSDTSWAREIIENSFYEKIFNPFGFIIRKTTSDIDKQIKSINTFEYGNSIEFCEKEIIKDIKRNKTKSYSYKYLYSKNKITMWNLTSGINLRQVEYIFDSNSNMTTINRFLNYQIPITGEIKKKLFKSIDYNNRKQIKSELKEDSLTEHCSKYFYKDDKLEKIEVHSKYGLNYTKVFSYDKSEFLNSIIWIRDGEELRKDLLVNDSYGNWIENNVEISNGWKLKIKRKINYYE